MKFSKVLSWAFWAIAFISIAPNTTADDAAVRILFDAQVFTGEPEHPYAEAVAIRNDKILAVGNLAEVEQAVGKSVEHLDLHRECLLPGFIDSHIHFVFGGSSLISADVTDKVASIADLVSFVAQTRKDGKGMRGDVLSISGMPLAFWSKTDELNAHFSTGEYAEIPIFLSGSDYHTGWANRALLRRAGITKGFIRQLTLKERAYYGVGADDEPNGFLVDAGLQKVREVLPPLTKEQLLAAGEAALRYIHSLGITSWLDPLADKSVLETYRQMSERGDLTAHVAALIQVFAKNPSTELANVQKLRQEFKDVHNLSIPGVKIFADGVVEYPSQTAAMTKPYRNTGKSGDLLFDPARFAELAIAADKMGLIVHVHALGDRAVKESLNGIEAARKANGNSGIPHTLTHVQFADPEDFPRFHRLGVIAALQLLWASGEEDTIELVKPYVDPDLYQWQYPARSLLDSGAIISGASDWPVSSPNVFQAIYQAGTRKGEEGVLDASQRMPREAMLYAYTRNSARAMNQQDNIGSIAPGKQADLVLVDRDVLTVSPEELRETKVIWTMVGGKIVYQSN
jgi:predicted amidohydrolase YtcJ